MKKMLTTLALFASMSFAAGTYNADLSHSSIGFKVKHMVISKTTGQFNDYKTTLNWDPANLKTSKMEVEIKVASIDTRDKKRDDHLRAPDFFDAAKYPTIKFVSTSIVKKGNDYVVTGNLTMKDVTKQIQIPFEATQEITGPWGMKRIGFSGEFSVNRQEYNVNFSKALDNGGLMVGNEVKIELNIEGVRKP